MRLPSPLLLLPSCPCQGPHLDYTTAMLASKQKWQELLLHSVSLSLGNQRSHACAPKSHSPLCLKLRAISKTALVRPPEIWGGGEFLQRTEVWYQPRKARTSEISIIVINVPLLVLRGCQNLEKLESRKTTKMGGSSLHLLKLEFTLCKKRSGNGKQRQGCSLLSASFSGPQPQSCRAGGCQEIPQEGRSKPLPHVL